MSLSSESIFQTLHASTVRRWIRKHIEDLLDQPERFQSDDFAQQFQAALNNHEPLLVPGLLTREAIRGLLSCQQVLESRTVRVQEESDVTWLETKFPDSCEIPYILLNEGGIIDSLVAGMKELNESTIHTSSWINCYRPGEYIPKHTDSEGVLQIIMELHHPGSGSSSFLTVGHEQISLKPGDVVLFQAHKIPHETDPVPKKPHVSRENAVLRLCSR